VNLVTGGGGFLGSHLVDALLASGEPVRVLEPPDAPVEHLPLQRVDLVRGDVRNVVQVRKAVQGCARIFHLAADPNLWRRRPQEFDAVNRQGTENVLMAGLDAGAERVLYTSTESILAGVGFNGGAVETLRLRAEDMIGPYCMSKFRAERFALRLAGEGAPVVVVAPTLPVGPGDRRMTPPTRMAVAMCRGQLPAVLECRMNLVDARDVAQGMISAIERGRPGVRYLLGGCNTSLSKWLGVLARYAGREPPRFRVPYFIALGVAWMSELWAGRISGRMPLATVTGVRLTRRCMHFDPSASLAELGLGSRPLTDSARDAVAWYRAQGWI